MRTVTYAAAVRAILAEAGVTDRAVQELALQKILVLREADLVEGVQSICKSIAESVIVEQLGAARVAIALAHQWEHDAYTEGAGAA